MALSTSALIFSLKVFFISVGVVSVAVIANCSVPPIIDFALHEVPVIWSTVLSFLEPPYLYFVINGIIITILASSRFHPNFDDEVESQTKPLASASSPSPSSNFSAVSPPHPLAFRVVEEPPLTPCEIKGIDVETMPVPMVNRSSDSQVIAAEKDREEDLFVLSSCDYTRQRRIACSDAQTESLSISNEKPLVSARFGHRKPIKASPEGGNALRKVAKPKKHETLESTWKMITDGRRVPLSRHLKKSDTWENRGHHVDMSAVDQPNPKQMRKLETFKDSTNYDPSFSSASPSPTSGKIPKEPSLSQDELNRRVEAFIKKINEEMRLETRIIESIRKDD